MAHFEEQAGQPYDWNEGGVYVIEREDPVDGGLDGVSNRQGRELTRRTRDLHTRQLESETGTPIAIEAAKNVAVGLAKGYTDQTAAAVRNELALGDQAALRSAKDYADRIVAALVDGSPEMLNTLEELAAALGNDPNFATTVMTEIGKRATMTQVDAALAGKLDTAGGTIKTIDVKTNTNHRLRISTSDITNEAWIGIIDAAGKCPSYLRIGAGKLQFYPQGDDGAARTIYHSGNFDPSGFATKTGVTADLDKKLDKTGGVIEGEHDSFIGAMTIGCGMPSWGSQTYMRFFYDNNVNETRIFVCGAPDNLPTLCLRANGEMIWAGHTVYHSGNLDKTKLDALPAKIIRGSVAADGNRTGGSGFHSYKVGGSIYVQHGLGHSQFMAVATVFAPENTHRDNVVTVIYKDSTNVCFQVTAGPDQEVEWAPFDFIIMPY